MNPLKIVVSGPVGAGKTTYIKCLSDSPVVSTEEKASEEIGKELTTVAMDYGSLSLEGQEIHLFGTPGQERFDFMWEVLCEGAVGMLLLIAGHQPQSFRKARHILDYITSQVPIPCVIGVTRQDLEKVWSPKEIANFLSVPREHVIGLDARDRGACLEALYEVFARIDAANGGESKAVPQHEA